jgi:hypothetical protein
MTITKLFKTAGVVAAFTIIIVLGMMNSSRHVRALDDQGDDREEARVRRGLAIAPVPLHFEEKSRVVEPYRRGQRPVAPIWRLLHPERIPSILPWANSHKAT